MSSINDRDMDYLYQKVCILHEKGTIPDCLKPVDTEAVSYYENMEAEDVRIHEYSVGNVPAFRKELEKLWDGQELRELIPVVTASAFKAKENTAEKAEDIEEIPTYIYNF